MIHKKSHVLTLSRTVVERVPDRHAPSETMLLGPWHRYQRPTARSPSVSDGLGYDCDLRWAFRWPCGLDGAYAAMLRRDSCDWNRFDASIPSCSVGGWPRLVGSTRPCVRAMRSRWPTIIQSIHPFASNPPQSIPSHSIAPESTAAEPWTAHTHNEHNHHENRQAAAAVIFAAGFGWDSGVAQSGGGGIV